MRKIIATGAILIISLLVGCSGKHNNYNVEEPTNLVSENETVVNPTKKPEANQEGGIIISPSTEAVTKIPLEERIPETESSVFTLGIPIVSNCK